MYGELYAAWQREIEEASLQLLPADFYTKVAEYVRRIKETRLQEKESLKVALLEQELKNVKRIIKQLVRMRQRKISKLIHESKKLPLDFTTAEEAQLNKGYLSLAEGYRAFVNVLLQGQSIQISLEKPVELPHRRVVLRFVKAMPAVIGGDMKTYGPFMPEDVASVPIENAKILVKQGFAVEVDIS